MTPFRAPLNFNDPFEGSLNLHFSLALHVLALHVDGYYTKSFDLSTLARLTIPAHFSVSSAPRRIRRFCLKPVSDAVRHYQTLVEISR